jgi:hypothetical protein
MLVETPKASRVAPGVVGSSVGILLPVTWRRVSARVCACTAAGVSAISNTPPVNLNKRPRSAIICHRPLSNLVLQNLGASRASG